MGFAGQVFAAKMAVGLAVPSAGALSRTGSLLAKGAAGIYNSLNSQRKTQAQKRVDEAQAEVDRLTKITESAAGASSVQIAQAAASGMKKLAMAGQDTEAVLRKGGEAAFQGMRGVMGKEGKQLFEGIEKATAPSVRMMKLTRNFARMSKADQKAAVTQ